MRTKSVIIMSIIVILMIQVCACNKGINIEDEKNESAFLEEESEEMEKQLITRAYLLEHGLATEEELEGVDVDAMAMDGGWVEGVEETLNVNRMIQLLKEEYRTDGYTFNYQYLVDSPLNNAKLSNDDMMNIKTIAFEYNEGTYFASMIFDLSEGKAYFGDAVDLLKKGAEPTQEIDLTEEQKEQIRAHMVSGDVAEWESSYKGIQREDSTGWFWWILYYELEDGSIYAHDGSGASGKSAPENYRDFVTGLEAFFETEE